MKTLSRFVTKFTNLIVAVLSCFWPIRSPIGTGPGSSTAWFAKSIP